MRTSGLTYMVLAAFFFSIMSALAKLAGETLPSQQIVFARSLIGLVLSWWFVKRGGLSAWGVNRRLLVMRGLFGFGGLSCFFYALTELPLADATVIMYTNPIWTALLAAAFLGERLQLTTLLGSLMALVGVVLVARPTVIFGAGAALPFWPVVVALVGALCAAGAYVSVRGLRRTDHALVVILWFPLIATPGSIPGMLPDAVWPNGTELLLLLGVGVAVQCAQVFMTWGLHREEAGRATAVSYVQVVFAYLWGIALFDEIPRASSVAGAAIIVASAVAIARARRPATRSSPT